jgi:hypothetical protein
MDMLEVAEIKIQLSFVSKFAPFTVVQNRLDPQPHTWLVSSDSRHLDRESRCLVALVTTA